MKNLFRLTSVIVLSSITFVACSQKERTIEAGNLKNITDSASYTLAYSQAMAWKSQGMEINPEVFAATFQQVFSGDTTALLTQEQMNQVMQSYQEAIISKQRIAMDAKAEACKKAATAFLEKNKTEKGVKTTASGLQYRVEKNSKGIKPKTTVDRVRFNYSLSVLNPDGTFSQPIENTFERKGEPTITTLDGLIPGVVEGFFLMSQGSIYEFWIPSDLAYGNMGADGIPGGSLLYFRIELVEVLPN